MRAIENKKNINKENGSLFCKNMTKNGTPKS